MFLAGIANVLSLMFVCKSGRRIRGSGRPIWSRRKFRVLVVIVDEVANGVLQLHRAAGNNTPGEQLGQALGFFPIDDPLKELLAYQNLFHFGTCVHYSISSVRVSCEFLQWHWNSANPAV
jgi:hypothetical protein